MQNTNQTLEEAPSGQATQTRRPRYQLRRVSVKTIHQVTPRRRRIVFEGQGLEDFHVDYPGQWIKFFFPATETTANSARVYTILAFDADQKEMTVDFYLHDKGVASEWAVSAQVGQEIEFAGPAGHFQIVDGKDWYLLVADDSTLAAMIAIAESLPPQSTAAPGMSRHVLLRQYSLRHHVEVRAGNSHGVGHNAKTDKESGLWPDGDEVSG